MMIANEKDSKDVKFIKKIMIILMIDLIYLPERSTQYNIQCTVYYKFESFGFQFSTLPRWLAARLFFCFATTAAAAAAAGACDGDGDGLQLR